MRVRPLRAGDSAPAIAPAASLIAENKLGGIGTPGLMAVMATRSLAHATRVRGRRHRQPQRDKVPRQRKQQQQSGRQTVHMFYRNEPK